MPRPLPQCLRVLKPSLFSLDQSRLAIIGAASRLARRFAPARRALGLPSPQGIEWSPALPDSSPNVNWHPVSPADEAIFAPPETNAQANFFLPHLNSRAGVHASGVARLRDAVVHGHNGGQYLVCGDRPVTGLGLAGWRHNRVPFWDSRLHFPRPRWLVGRVAVLAHGEAVGNYGHWCFDVLPRIGLLKRTGLFDTIDTFLVSHSGKGFQLETLERAGIPAGKIRVLGPSDAYAADDLAVPVLHRSCERSPDWVPAYLREEFGDATTPTRKRRLFVSRKDASFRALVEEDALFESLRPLGFERITLAGVSLSETIALFTSAEAVVGPFGSGLMNVAFCPPGGVSVEIVAPEFFYRFHWLLAARAGLRHGVYFGNGRVINPRGANDGIRTDIRVDVDDCAAFIRRLVDDHLGARRTNVSAAGQRAA